MKSLKGRANETRLRVGDWRVIIVAEAERAVVTRVVNRRDAYG
ncbi:MAG: type II toxin-antitoxin system RelE family toxin [Dehalococcoidia bacterium]